jgi:hypothetical protein
MITNRRNFIKATATVSLLGTSAARADASSPWICFLHSTRLDAAWQQGFLDGLAGQNKNGDPENTSTSNDVNILFHNAGGKYQANNNSNLQRAISNMISELQSQPKLIVAAGGMVSALAADGQTKGIPILVIMGRTATFNGGQSVGGWYMDDTSNGNVTLAKKSALLAGSPFNRPTSQQWLIYNGNSKMGSDEAKEWGTIVNSKTQAIDASFAIADNDKLKIPTAIKNATQAGAKAIVISGDPKFTTRAARIVHYQKNYPGLVMCYPFQEYGDEAQDANISTTDYLVYGPRLANVYKQLGDLAGQYLNDASTTLGLKLLPPTAADNPYYIPHDERHRPGRGRRRSHYH